METINWVFKKSESFSVQKEKFSVAGLKKINIQFVKAIN